MNRHKVNRFTFDAHSVVLFSALALTGAVSANTAQSQRNTQVPALTSSLASSAARPSVQQQTLSTASAQRLKVSANKTAP
ncbi:hypothetical protein E9531_15880 [Lampropedia puyangensis]|uniref:Uncharacterized protein n=1 Tax=Lampropedia puyangensis TaxID=1330072 RepID=A0A4S8ERF6_9BURK|nr:hypothetical protein [Lampropedia puyangensis]THT97459.1 hypothetical protein E9531_15880 [Lampropedia puyangensis]